MNSRVEEIVYFRRLISLLNFANAIVSWKCSFNGIKDIEGSWHSVNFHLRNHIFAEVMENGSPSKVLISDLIDICTPRVEGRIQSLIIIRHEATLILQSLSFFPFKTRPRQLLADARIVEYKETWVPSSCVGSVGVKGWHRVGKPAKFNSEWCWLGVHSVVRTTR